MTPLNGPTRRHREAVFRLDPQIADQALELRPDSLTDLARTITALANTEAIGVVTTLGALGAPARHRRSQAIGVSTAVDVLATIRGEHGERRQFADLVDRSNETVVIGVTAAWPRFGTSWSRSGSPVARRTTTRSLKAGRCGAERDGTRWELP